MADYNYLYGKLYQFRLRYIFDDFEKTVWSSISKVPLPVSVLNADYTMVFNAQNYSNQIAIIFDTQDPEIIAIEISVREGNDGLWMLLDTIKKYDHNWDVLVESNIEYNYIWGNETVLYPLDQTDTNRLYDYVPQIAQTTELINENQLVDANYIEGYDNIDIDVSLDYEIVQNPDGFGYKERIFEINEYNLPLNSVPENSYVVIYVAYGESPRRYIMVVDKREEGETILAVALRLESQLFDAGVTTIDVTGDNVLIIREPTSQNHGFIDAHYTTMGKVVKSFKYRETHYLGIVYYDRALRSGATNTSEGSQVYIPAENILFPGNEISKDSAAPSVKINYQINHVPPVWAKYWQWVYGESYSNYLYYHTIGFNPFTTLDNPEVNIDTNTLPVGYTYIPFNITIRKFNSDFKDANIPEWVYEKGDMIRLVGFTNTNGLASRFFYDSEPMEVHEIVESYVEAGIFAIRYVPRLGRLVGSDENGSNTNLQPVFEVFRKPMSFTEGNEYRQYFEIGELNPVLNPYTEDRSHGLINPNGKNRINQQVADGVSILPASGDLECEDSYSRLSTSFSWVQFSPILVPVISQSYSDFFPSDVHNKGRINVIDDTARRVELTTGLRWGGNYINQTRINNLSSFNFDDFDTITEKFGEITRLKQIGDVLQVRQQYRSTSIYVGRVELRQSAIDEQGFIAQSTNLLGTRYVSKEKWGCINPESEVQNGQISYYFDIHNGAIIADGYNKPVPISDIGLKDYIKELSTELLSNYQNIKVIGGFDSKNDFLYYNIHAEPKLAGGNKNITLIFKDGWRCFVDLEDANGNPPEHFASIGQDFISFLNGSLYQHNTGSLNTFFGKFQPVSVKLVFNQVPESNKIFRRLRLNADTADWQCPEYGDLVIKKTPTFPMGMQTKIPQISLRDEEGFLFADIPNNAGFPPTMKDWVNGEPMRGQALTITLKNSAEGESNLHSASVIEQPT